VYLPGPGADPCADEVTLRRAVIQRLGRDPFRDDADRTVVVSLHRDGADLAAWIELRDRAGRTLGAQEIRSRAATCAELAAAIEFTLSMVLDARVSETPAPPPAAEPMVTPAAPGAEIAVSLGALVAFAAAPTTVWGASFGVEARWPSYSLALEGRLDAPSEQALAEGSLKSSLWMATLVPCLRPSWLGVCGLFAAGVQGGEVDGVPGGVSATALYLAPGLRLAVFVPMGSIFSAQLRGDVLIPIAKTSLYAGLEQVWVTPPVSFVVGLAVAAQISR
jgi:hypothetical protein